jgi:GNAT superfamily N-acetyltransferase
LGSPGKARSTRRVLCGFAKDIHPRVRLREGPLDDFIRALVSHCEKRNPGRTYVAVRAGERRVLGYYTLSSGSVSFQNLPASPAKKLPKHPVPVILLARLAVDASVQGQGLGAALLTDALACCFYLAGKISVHAVEVDAIDDAARSFYETYGFVPLLDNPLHLYLPIATVRQAFGKT